MGKFVIRAALLGLAVSLVLALSALGATRSFATVPSRGSLTVGTAAYTPPAGAIYVSPGGKDTNPGTLVAPFRTLGVALARALPGTTIVLRAGIYHESVASAQPVTIQNYPLESVWFDGSVAISEFTKSGAVWVHHGWTKEFSSMMGGDATFKARFVDSVAPMAANPDQVFRDGVQQKQVGSLAEVVAGTFYMDYAADTITVGSDPTGHLVRASDLAQAMRLSGDSTTVRGIGIRNYANGYEVRGALYVTGSGSSVENVLIRDVATAGLTLSKPNKRVDHVTIKRAGILGIAGFEIDGSVIQNSVIDDNDYQNFKPEPEAGGIKITAARGVIVRNNETNGNHRGTGIWFDVSSYDITLVNNTANSNGRYGFEIEISAKGVVANNYAVHNASAGITLLNAGDFKVFNNEVGDSDLIGINLSEDERRQADGLYLEGRDPRMIDQVDPTVPWLTQNNVISNNVFGNHGYFQLYALAKRGNRAVDLWNLTVNGNLFNKRVASADPTMVAWGKGDNVTLERYETPAALAAAKNPTWVNAQIAGSKSIVDMATDKLTYQAVAIPLPSDVAAAIGQPVGVKHLGNF